MAALSVKEAAPELLLVWNWAHRQRVFSSTLVASQIEFLFL